MRRVTMFCLVILSVFSTLAAPAPIRAQEPAPTPQLCNTDLNIDRVQMWVGTFNVGPAPLGAKLSYTDRLGLESSIFLSVSDNRRVCLDEMQSQIFFTFLEQSIISSVTEAETKSTYFCYDLEEVTQWAGNNSASLQLLPDRTSPTIMLMIWMAEGMPQSLALEGRYGAGNTLFCVKAAFLPLALPVLGNPDQYLDFEN